MRTRVHMFGIAFHEVRVEVYYSLPWAALNMIIKMNMNLKLLTYQIKTKLHNMYYTQQPHRAIGILSPRPHVCIWASLGNSSHLGKARRNMFAVQLTRITHANIELHRKWSRSIRYTYNWHGLRHCKCTMSRSIKDL